MKYNSLQLILLYQMLHKLRTYIFLILENILSCRRAYSHFNFDDLISLSMAYLMRWSRRLKDSLFHGSLQSSLAEVSHWECVVRLVCSFTLRCHRRLSRTATFARSSSTVSFSFLQQIRCAHFFQFATTVRRFI